MSFTDEKSSNIYQLVGLPIIIRPDVLDCITIRLRFADEWKNIDNKGSPVKELHEVFEHLPCVLSQRLAF